MDTYIVSSIELRLLENIKDQVSVKGIYTVEANKELDAFRASKANYVTMGATNIRKSEKEAVNAVYNMTLVLPGTKLTPME